MNQRWKRAVTTVVALAAVAIGTVMGAQAASAAPVPDAITTVSVEQDSAQSGTQVKIDLDWSVPNGAQPGDHFTLQLPSELSRFIAAFDLTDDDGSVVAKAVVDNAGLVTFTLTDFVASHPFDVHGSAYFWATFRSAEDPGTPVTVTFTTDSGDEFDDVITVVGATQINRTVPVKAGSWADPTDQGTTKPTGALVWSVAAPRGPFSTLVFEDLAQPGIEIACGTPVRVYSTMTTNANGGLINLVTIPAADYAAACTPQGITVSMNRPVADGEFIQVTFNSTIVDPALSSYANTATVTADGRGQTTSAKVDRKGAGGTGTGTGMGPLKITKVVAGDGTPSGPFTIVVDCTWAGRPAPGFPQTLTFQGAESQTLSAPVSSTCTATEPESGGAETVEISEAATVTAATTGTAEITITNTFVKTPPPVDPTDPPATPEVPRTPEQPPARGSLAITGAEAPSWLLAAGVAATLAGGVLVTTRLIRGRRAPSEH